MRLALDARPMFDSRFDGDGRAAWLTELYRRLREVRPDWRVMAYHRPAEDGQPFAFVPAVLVAWFAAVVG